MQQVLAQIIPPLMVALGILSIVRGIRRKGRCSLPVLATVVNVEEDYTPDDDGGGSYDYTPVLGYEVGGRRYTERANFSSSRSRAFKEGQTMELRVNPNKPTEFHVPGKSNTVGFGIALIVFGSMIFAAMHMAS